MKQKYELRRAGRGFLIGPIEDNIVWFAARILSCKLLRKMRPTKCTAEAVELAEQCAAGVTFNWSQFLLNELINDAEQAQDEPKAKFHYDCSS